MNAIRRLFSALASSPSVGRVPIIEPRRFVPMWDHECEVEGALAVAVGEPCNWCGAEEAAK